MSILIAGYGNIGKFIHKELTALNPHIYDINIPKYKDSILNNYDVAFICVPTEMNPDGSADISIVDEVAGLINADVIVIKSAVPVGTADMLTQKYGKNFVVSPEYYGTTQHSENSPDFLILGGEKKACGKVAELYGRVKKGGYKIKFTDTKTAELAKYMENCFLALKVTFCNEFADVAAELGIDYPELREIFISDERMGDSHTFVYPDKPYYDSHCLNKDVPALISFAGEKAPLISAMNDINLRRKKVFQVKYQ